MHVLGMGQRRLLSYLSPIVLCFVVMTGMFSCWLSPQSEGWRLNLMRQQDVHALAHNVVPGHFRPIGTSDAVLYVKDASSHGLHEVFLARSPSLGPEGPTFDFSVAKQAEI